MCFADCHSISVDTISQLVPTTDAEAVARLLGYDSYLPNEEHKYS
jgi:hypothetical protein